MKKNTVIALVVFLILLGVTLLMSLKTKSDKEQTKHFDIKAISWIQADSQIAKKSAKDLKNKNKKTHTIKEIKNPEDIASKIIIERNKNKIVIEKQAKDVWLITSPRKMTADTYKIKQILSSFKNAIHSIEGKKLKEAQDKIYYGLDDKDKIRLAVFARDKQFVDLWIGNAEKTDEKNMQYDTFVMKSNGQYVFRMEGVNLRSGVDHPIKELRSKKIFTFKKQDIAGIEIHIPKTASTQASDLILKKQETDNKDNKKDTSGKWIMIKPGGFTLMDMSSYISTLSSLYAREFVMKPNQKTGLENEKNAYAIKIKLKDNAKPVVLFLGDKGKDFMWAKASGIQEYIKISQYTAKSLKKALVDFKDKSLFPIKIEQITGLVFKNNKEQLKLEKQASKWKFSGKYASVTVGDEEINKVLRGINSFRVDQFLTKADYYKATKGLQRNAHEIHISIQGGAFDVVLSSADKDKKQYGHNITTGDYFKCTTYNGGKLIKTINDLRRHAVFVFKKQDIAKIILKPDNAKTITIEPKEIKNNKNPKNNKTVWAIIKPKVNAKQDSNKIEQLATTLTTLEAKTFTDSSKLKKEKLFLKNSYTISVQLKDNSKHKLIISNKKQKGNNYCTSTEPAFHNAIFTINSYQINRVKKTLDELTTKK